MNKISIEQIDLELINEEDKCERNRLNIMPLDFILDGGILNKSDIIQLVGETMTFKTSISLQISKSYCESKKHVLYIDSNGSITEERLKNYGLNTDLKSYFHFFKKSCFDEVSCILDKYIQTGEVSLIVIDSIADLINKGYFNINMNSKGKTEGIALDNKNSNYDSKPLATFIKKYTKLATEYGYSMILTNQLRSKMVKKIGTVERRQGPKILDYSCTHIFHLVECKSNSLSDGMDTLSSLKPLYLKVIKSNNSLTDNKYPVLMKKGLGFSNDFLIIHYMLSKQIIIKAGTYYELKDTGIKENGLANFMRAVPTSVLEHYYTDALKFVESYYKTI